MIQFLWIPQNGKKNCRYVAFGDESAVKDWTQIYKGKNSNSFRFKFRKCVQKPVLKKRLSYILTEFMQFFQPISGRVDKASAAETVDAG